MQPRDQRAVFWTDINDDQTAVAEMNDRAIALSHIPKINVGKRQVVIHRHNLEHFEAFDFFLAGLVLVAIETRALVRARACHDGHAPGLPAARLHEAAAPEVQALCDAHTQDAIAACVSGI